MSIFAPHPSGWGDPTNGTGGPQRVSTLYVQHFGRTSNALSTVRGFSELLLNNPEKLDHPDVVKKYVEYIHGAADNAADTVRRMRKFYRPAEEATHEPLDLNAIVTDAIAMTQPRWKEEEQARGRNIRTRVSLGQVPQVLGHESELHEVLTNLIFNAVDAIDKEGEVSIATRREDDEVVLEVTDTGSGMDEQTLQNCFNPFYTTKGTKGTGLGLSVTQGIVRRHQGDIEVDSEPGQGTSVYVRLPVGEKGETGGITPDEAVDGTGSLHILVVEDGVEQRELISEMLENGGHDVDVATDGQEGLRKFDNGWYDLVMTDRSMPEFGGDELAEMIKDRAPHKPVIMVTGFGDMMDAAGEKPEHVDLLVSKPVSREKLETAISKVTCKDPQSTDA